MMQSQQENVAYQPPQSQPQLQMQDFQQTQETQQFSIGATSNPLESFSPQMPQSSMQLQNQGNNEDYSAEEMELIRLAEEKK